MVETLSLTLAVFFFWLHRTETAGKPAAKNDDASKPGSLALIEKVLSQHRAAIDGALAKWLPRKFDNANMEFICGKARYAYDTESMTKGVAEPIWNILDRGGKRWRPTLLILVAEALGAKLENVLDFVAICELVHNGSLVVDGADYVEFFFPSPHGRINLHLTSFAVLPLVKISRMVASCVVDNLACTAYTHLMLRSMQAMRCTSYH